jgi:hypothetical protein
LVARRFARSRIVAPVGDPVRVAAAEDKEAQLGCAPQLGQPDRPGFDALSDHDGLLDECESTPVISPECDKDGVVDTCDAFRVVSNPPSYTFGRALVLEEDLLMVGDPSYPAEYAGAVHTYVRNANGWSHSGIILSPDPSLYTSFGFAIAGSGHRLSVAGDNAGDGNNVRAAGAARHNQRHEQGVEEGERVPRELRAKIQGHARVL